MRGGKREGAGAKPTGRAKLRKTVFLPEHTVNEAEKRGEGNLSEGLIRSVDIAGRVVKS